MKMLKVTDEVHRAVKIEAAKAGVTAATLASQLLDHSLQEVEAGRLLIPDEPGAALVKPTAKRKAAAAAR